MTDNCWIGSLWKFCSDHGVALEADHHQAPAVQRDNDAYLMELFAARCTFSTTTKLAQEEWRSLNRCRLFLQVLFLSDITNGDGTHIRRDYLLYNGSSRRPQNSRWEWPLQKPTRSDWTRWVAALRQLSSREGRLGTDDRLGAWL